jgi:hypothetical protein
VKSAELLFDSAEPDWEATYGPARNTFPYRMITEISYRMSVLAKGAGGTKQTEVPKDEYDYLAPDGREIWLLANLEGRAWRIARLRRRRP